VPGADAGKNLAFVIDKSVNPICLRDPLIAHGSFPFQ
jgi:hypothetical protein